MDTELKNYIKNGVILEKDVHPTKAFAFIATFCHYSKEAVKQLSKMGIECKYYAIDRNQFVNEKLKDVGGSSAISLTKFWKDNVQYKCGNWSYPHIFFKDTNWHYVGGLTDIQSNNIKIKL